MKAIKCIGWISLCAGVLVILLGLISGIIGKSVLPIQHVVNYFHVANSFFLIAIALFIVVHKCDCNNK